MKTAQIVNLLEQIAPVGLAEDWDNVGLLIGARGANVRKVMLCIDLTPEVLREAIAEKVQMVMAYHPVIFKSVSRVTAEAEEVVYEAIRRGIGVYSMHTALDVAPGGTNDVLADAMGLGKRKPLKPASGSGQCKIVVFGPAEEVADIARAAFAAGAGVIGNYTDCGFFGYGIGSYAGGPGSSPTIGQSGHPEAVEEVRLELICPPNRVDRVCDAIRAAHSYETPAIDVYPLSAAGSGAGMGRVGALSRPVTVATLISRIKKATGVKRLLLAARPRPKAKAGKGDGKGSLVSVVACGAGACGPLWKDALAAGAGFFLTGEMRHHDALAATNTGLTVVCVGHSNSERMTMVSLADRIAEAMPKLKVMVSKLDRDPFEIV
ncbi:MAG: Nif3-like dinuclear metal center hexameric protein [Phycisphaerae bacterium]|jgi:dinuclear metal center YbgI/SA1388 family protein|nr:Nif3-like dinuclear metal center hexameric protein [Phycisphaerae bacterium]MDP7288840.1 Nif3-like dinuclear metal center hexameric protein [Phycisphaerae bacterium]